MCIGQAYSNILASLAKELEKNSLLLQERCRFHLERRVLDSGYDPPPVRFRQNIGRMLDAYGAHVTSVFHRRDPDHCDVVIALAEVILRVNRDPLNCALHLVVVKASKSDHPTSK